MSWAERPTGIAPTITNSCARTMLGRIGNIDADIARHPRADRRAFGPFHVEDTGTPTTAMVPSPVNLSTVLGDW